MALITPFRRGEVDFDALKRLVDWHIEQGTNCLAPVGTTGESPTLDHEEHERVIAAVTERAAGRIKLSSVIASYPNEQLGGVAEIARMLKLKGAA